jgi:hypothetical protein
MRHPTRPSNVDHRASDALSSTTVAEQRPIDSSQGTHDRADDEYQSERIEVSLCLGYLRFRAVRGHFSPGCVFWPPLSRRSAMAGPARHRRRLATKRRPPQLPSSRTQPARLMPSSEVRTLAFTSALSPVGGGLGSRASVGGSWAPPLPRVLGPHWWWLLGDSTARDGCASTPAGPGIRGRASAVDCRLHLQSWRLLTAGSMCSPEVGTTGFGRDRVQWAARGPSGPASKAGCRLAPPR